MITKHYLVNKYLLLNGSRLSQVAKAADGARDGRVPPIAVETQKITRSWSVADDDNSVYFLLKVTGITLM